LWASARASNGACAPRCVAQDAILPTVVDARFAKPLDAELLMGLCERHARILLVEEHALAGGFGSRC